MPSDSSSEGHPIRITLKNVNVSQDGEDPNHAFITIEEGNYEVHERVGTLTVLAPDTVYYCESGADGEWTKGSGETLGFVYSGGLRGAPR